MTRVQPSSRIPIPTSSRRSGAGRHVDPGTCGDQEDGRAGRGVGGLFGQPAVALERHGSLSLDGGLGGSQRNTDPMQSSGAARRYDSLEGPLRCASSCSTAMVRGRELVF